MNTFLSKFNDIKRSISNVRDELEETRYKHHAVFDYLEYAENYIYDAIDEYKRTYVKDDERGS